VGGALGNGKGVFVVLHILDMPFVRKGCREELSEAVVLVYAHPEDAFVVVEGGVDAVCVAVEEDCLLHCGAGGAWQEEGGGVRVGGGKLGHRGSVG